MKIWNCSQQTIKNWMKKFDLKSPKGFFRKEGARIGRAPGFKCSEHQKEFMHNRMLGEKNPFYGKKHSLKTRKLMSKNHADFSGEKNPFAKALKGNFEKKKEHSERCKKIWEGRDQKWRDKFGKKLSKSLAESKKRKKKSLHKNHNSGHLITQKGGRIFCRSSWEKEVCSILDNESIVLKFEFENLVIPYQNDAKQIRYCKSDFLIYFSNGNKSLIEVKPEALHNYGKNPFKILGQKEFCKKYKIQFSLIGEDPKNHKIEVQKILRAAFRGELYVQ